MSDGLRLTEILTTASAAANYQGAPTVEAEHLRIAIELLTGRLTMEDLGRPQSPLVARMTKAGSGVAPEVKELAGRWFARLGDDPLAEFDEARLAEFTAEISTLKLGSTSPGSL